MSGEPKRKPCPSTDKDSYWKSIDFRAAKSHVKKLQSRISAALAQGELDKAERLMFMLTHLPGRGVSIRSSTYRNGRLVREESQWNQESVRGTDYTYEIGAPAEGLVRAQLITAVEIPPLDNNPITYRFEYDGTDLVKSWYSCDGTIEYSYDHSFYKPLGENGHWPAYVLDENGLCTEQNYWDNYRTVYTYDENSRRLSAACLDSEGNGTVFPCDEGGRYIKHEDWEAVYDDEGMLCEVALWEGYENAVISYEIVYVTPEKAAELADIFNYAINDY